MVEVLPDGRLFVPMSQLTDAPELAEWFRTHGAGNALLRRVLERKP